MQFEKVELNRTSQVQFEVSFFNLKEKWKDIYRSSVIPNQIPSGLSEENLRS